MRIKIILSLLKKEFLNIIRDKKSFITMILLPLLAFPLVIGITTLLLTSYTSVDNNEILFGVDYEIDDDFKDYLDNYSDEYEFKVDKDTKGNLKDKFDNGKLSIYVLKEDNTYNIHYDENSTNDLATIAIVNDLYASYKETYIENRLSTQGIDYNKLKDEFNIVSVQESITEMGSLVPVVLSMMLTMLIASTAFSVAIEITTSEKEKGTLETILSLPIKKSELITSKYLTTASMATLSGILTYISLFVTLYMGSDTLTMLGFTSLEINASILLIYLVAIILFSIFLSGIILSIAIFCKSLKEAQNTLMPIEVGIGLVSYLPMLGVNATIKNSIIPFANIALLFNNALSSKLDPLFIVLTFLSTIAYAMLLMLIVSKIYNEEDALFHTAKLKYISFTSGKGKTVVYGIFTSILLLIITYLLSIYTSMLFATSSTYVLLAIMPLTILAVVLISGLIIKLDFKKAFKLKKFNIIQFIKLLFLFIGIRIISEFIITGITNLFPSMVEDFTPYENMISVDNLYMGILLIAILPAVAEELLFRGVLFNSLNKKLKPWLSIIISALIFGIYHMNWLQGINAFILGIALGYAYHKTKSIFVPMILHFLNNGYSVLLMQFPKLNIELPMYGKILVLALGIILVIYMFYKNEKELRK